MDKQKLIDGIINDNQGVNPEGAIWHIPLGGGLEYLLGEKEFNKRAKEMGWVNGYKYGVEYETNCKKPDLPDDVVIEWFDEYGNWIKTNCRGVLWNVKDGGDQDILKFRIVDQRFNPVEVEQVQATINLPAVGEFVDIADNQFLMYGQGEKNCEVLAHVENTAVVRMSYGLGCFTADNLVRKADKQRQHLIDIITSMGNLSEGMLADAILAAGFTNNKEKQ